MQEHLGAATGGPMYDFRLFSGKHSNDRYDQLPQRNGPSCSVHRSYMQMLVLAHGESFRTERLLDSKEV